MNVLLVNDNPVGVAGSGGVEDYVASLARLLRGAGHTAITVTGQTRGAPERHTPTSHCLPGLNAPPLRKNILHHRWEQHRALVALRRIATREKPDVIHIHNLTNPLVLHALRQMGPTVKSIHDCRPFCAKPRPGVATRLVGNTDEFCHRSMSRHCWKHCYAKAGVSLKDRLEAWSYFPNNLLALRQVKACDRLIVPSRYIRELALAAGVAKTDIDLLHYFCDFEDHVPNRHDDPAACPSLFFAGRHTLEKGILHLLSAIDRMPPIPFEVIIAGTGPLSEQARKHAARMQTPRRITFTGYIERADLIEQYASASLVVFPSIGSEGCPLTGIEAMHCGTPVIAFDVGGVPEWLIHGETGLLVPRGDVQGLADAMTTLIQSPARRQVLGSHARDFIRAGFSRDAHLNGLLETYQKTLRGVS